MIVTNMSCFRKKLLMCFIILLVFYFIYWWYEGKFARLLFIAGSKNDSTDIEKTRRYLAKRNGTQSVGAIVILIGDDYKKLAVRLSSIDERLLDNHKNDIIIFHTGYPFSYDISQVLNSTKRHVVFRNVDHEFSSFPSGFNPYSTNPTWSKRGKWNYHHMIRFWFKLIFELPEIQQYDYIMRLDDDSQLLGIWFNVFTMLNKKNAVYFANNQLIEYENGLPDTMKLKDICLTYKKNTNISLDDPKKFEHTFLKNGIRTYYNNFEIMNTHFFRRTDVRQWIDMIDATHGIYKYRWGDAVLRYLTLMFFAKSEQILHRQTYNLSYCHPC